MVTVYGIKNCSSVQKAVRFCKNNNIEYKLVDFREEPLDKSKIRYFASKADINTLFNNRGQKYKDLNLKELNLNDEEKLQWLIRENMLLKRPVVEYDNNILVGFDEKSYKEELIK